VTYLNIRRWNTPPHDTNKTDTATPDKAVQAPQSPESEPTAETKSIEAAATENTSQTEAAKQSEPSETPKKAHKIYKTKPQKRLCIYNHREMKEDGTAVEIPNSEFWMMPKNPEIRKILLLLPLPLLKTRIRPINFCAKTLNINILPQQTPTTML